ncbi:MAG: universal stress protein [Phycisphaerae bacterium]
MAGERTILAAVDFSDVTDAVLEQAARLGRQLRARVILLHVAPDEPPVQAFEAGPGYVRDVLADHLRHRHAQLLQCRKKIEHRGLSVHALLTAGQPDEGILRQARRFQPEMIVLGSHGHGRLYHLLTGSVSASVLHDAPCPVLVVPSRMAAKPDYVSDSSAVRKTPLQDGAEAPRRP